jgi:hypothetical protein
LIEELIEDALRSSAGLSSSIEDRWMIDRARELWVEHSPEPRESSKAGIDSGWNYLQFQGFYVYAVDAVSVDAGSNHVAAPRHEVGASGMSVEIRGRVVHDPNLFLESRGMEFEADLALESSPRVDLVLLDGSLLARIYDYRSRSISTLAEAVPKLLELDNAVFIAKRSQSTELIGRSQSTELIGGPLGDIYYFSRATPRAGFSAPCASNGVTHFYARLEDYAEVLRVEVPGSLDGAPPCPSASREGEWAETRRLMDSLAHGSVDGYPYVLILAHEMAHIGDVDMRALADLMGVGFLETGREVLGERGVPGRAGRRVGGGPGRGRQRRPPLRVQRHHRAAPASWGLRRGALGRRQGRPGDGGQDRDKEHNNGEVHELGRRPGGGQARERQPPRQVLRVPREGDGAARGAQVEQGDDALPPPDAGVAGEEGLGV